MKKFTLVASMALIAASASAQYACDPELSTVLAQGKVATVEYIALDGASVDELTNQGATVQNFGPGDETSGRNLWIWDQTFTGGDSSYPGVGMHFEGYASFVVGTAGWSGAGYNIAATANCNTLSWNDNTHFHIAYMSSGNAPASIALIIADGETDCGSKPAKVALGDNYVDGGQTYPAIAPKASDDWQGVDITFADLKKFWPTFDPKSIEGWNGNILAFLAGGTTGQTFAFDAIYFYNLDADSGVANIANNADWVVTGKTINVNGANGIELYNIAGQQVKSTNGSTLGTTNLPAGIYVAKSGNSVRKVVVK